MEGQGDSWELSLNCRAVWQDICEAGFSTAQFCCRWDTKVLSEDRFPVIKQLSVG